MVKTLAEEEQERIEKENQRMGRGDYHPVKIKQIILERKALRERGFFVAYLPEQTMYDASDVERHKTRHGKT